MTGSFDEPFALQSRQITWARALINAIRPLPRPLGLRPQLMGLFTLTALVTGLVLGTTLIQSNRSAQRDEVLEGNLVAADIAAQFAGRYVEAAQLSLMELASRPALVEAVLSDHPEEMTSEIIRFLALNPRLDGLSLVDVHGVTRATGVVNPTSTGIDLSDREWFSMVMSTRAPYLGLPVVSRVTGHPTVPYAVPVLDAEGIPHGVVGGGISLTVLTDVIVGIRVSRSARASLIDRRGDGLIIANVDPGRILRPPRGEPEVLRALLAGESGAREASVESGEATLDAFAPAPGLPWSVLIREPSASAFASLAMQTRSAVALVAVAVVLASALGAWLTYQITSPLVRRAAATALAQGDLSRRVSLTQLDEIGDLGRAFDGMAANMTERRAALEAAVAEQQAAIAELESFTYTVAHDLRAPLRAMDGFSQILLEEFAAELPLDGQRYVRLVSTNAKQMGELVDDLLSFAHLGRQSLAVHPVAPASIVRQALADLQAEQAGRHVDVEIGELPHCQADPALLRQVYTNLLTNALKFSRSRDPAKIEIGWDGNDGLNSYFVRDNGVGFDMRYAHKLFGVFQRLHRAEEYEGTGVGLAIVQRIVQRHGGRVWAEGQLGQGATFFFTLEGGPPAEPTTAGPGFVTEGEADV